MIVIDVETTGTDIRKHALISVGAIEFENPNNQFYEECRMWEGAHILDEALTLNKFTKKEITDPKKQSLEELMKKFVGWGSACKDHTFAGHNVDFDKDFLKESARRARLNWPFAERSIDTHAVCYAHMLKQGIQPPTKNNHSDLGLTAIISYVGLERRDAHNALSDALFTAEVLSRLLYDTPLLEEFKGYPIPWSSS